MSIVGICGWDAAPIRVDASLPYGRVMTATAKNVLPLVVRQQLRRDSRGINWVDAKGGGLYVGEFNVNKANGYRPADGHRSRCCTARGESSRSTPIPA